jgi:hypothetical protein
MTGFHRFVVVLAACGAGQQSRTPPSQPPPVVATSRSDPAPDAICARLATLKNEHCGFFTDVDVDAKCPSAFRAAQEGAPSTERLALRALGRCVVSNQRCDDTQRCVGTIEHFRAKPAVHAPAPQVACERLHGALSRCGYGVAAKDRETCVALLTEHPQLLERAGHCWVDEGNDCDHVTYCMQESSFDKSDLRACTDDDPNKAVGVLEAQWVRRNGAGVTKYSQARSTKAAPIEVCGFLAENEWLFAATCDDGSHPIKTRVQAEQARVGNEGHAGRCGSIVDLYKVKCPEKTYEVHIDLYVCPLTE